MAIFGSFWAATTKAATTPSCAKSSAHKAHAVLLIGAAAEKIAAHLEGAVRLIHCGTLERAVAEAAASARPGDIVLLAPACSSFDQFQNYEHRGQVFKQLVKDLKHGAAA